jgi:hypothetical protein
MKIRLSPFNRRSGKALSPFLPVPKQSLGARTRGQAVLSMKSAFRPLIDGLARRFSLPPQGNSSGFTGKFRRAELTAGATHSTFLS